MCHYYLLFSLPGLSTTSQDHVTGSILFKVEMVSLCQEILPADVNMSGTWHKGDTGQHGQGAYVSAGTINAGFLTSSRLGRSQQAGGQSKQESDKREENMAPQSI